LGVGEARVLEVLQRAHRHVERPRPADRVVDVGRSAVERDLDVHVVARGQPLRHLLVEPDAVGGELDPHLVARRVVDELPEIGTDGGLAAADVDVEDLHLLQFVDDRLALLRAQLAGIASPGGAQAVHTGEVAGVGELPRQADGGVQAALELVDEAPDRGGAGGRGQRAGHGVSSIMRDAASAPSACRYRRAVAGSSMDTPTAAQASLAVAWSARERTTSTMVGDLRKLSFRVWKW